MLQQLPPPILCRSALILHTPAIAQSTLVLVQGRQITHTSQLLLGMLLVNLFLGNLRSLLVDSAAVEPVESGNNDVTETEDGKGGAKTRGVSR